MLTSSRSGNPPLTDSDSDAADRLLRSTKPAVGGEHV
jgi:hypothetical protein